MSEITSDDGPCEFCGEPTQSLAGNPGLWPLMFAHPDNTGISRYHHVKCTTNRLFAPRKITDAMVEAFKWDQPNIFRGLADSTIRRALEAAERAR